MELMQEINKLAVYDLQVKLLTDTAIAPEKAHETDAGFDICSDEEAIIRPGERKLISTGIAIELDSKMCYARIAPRSGLAVKWGIDVMAGVVDSGYQGEVKVCLINHSEESYFIGKGDRIAQLILTIIMPTSEVVVFEEFEEGSGRGSKGFGSTGK